MRAKFLRLLADRNAVTAIEYAILAGLIAVVIIGSVATVGTALLTMYNHVKDQVVLAMQ